MNRSAAYALEFIVIEKGVKVERLSETALGETKESAGRPIRTKEGKYIFDFAGGHKNGIDFEDIDTYGAEREKMTGSGKK
jgi:hypothetical protein